jgi:DNA gyrase subunit A
MAFIDEHIEETAITGVLSTSFLDYAMSVIASRALPDVRDGLKPVHRRILYSMNDLGMTHDKPFKKSARIVGDVIGKYHPHGDSAVYETMVRLAQDWNMRSTLINMHGNNGSMDGDSAAAMRYTEAKLSKLSDELLRDLKKNTVDFQPNYDETEMEPTVLPARFPNLLVNGSEGIAVGMATKIPPHNLKEVVNGTIALLENPDITTEGLMEHIKGPDFPTGAQILGSRGIIDAYSTGKGTIVMRGVVDIIKKKDKTKLLIREIPYQVNPTKLVADILQIQDDWKDYMKELNKKTSKGIVKEKGLDFLVDDSLKNLTSSKNEDWNVTIEMTLKKDVEPELVLNYLYKNTSLQTTYSMNNLSLVPRITSKGETKLEPKRLPLKNTLMEYIKHQIEVVTRKNQFDLDKAEAKCHRIAGIIVALNHLDETIQTIRNAKDKEEARRNLISSLSIDDLQATAILDMQLHRLTNIDQDKQREEYNELLIYIESLKNKLGDERLIKREIKESLEEVVEKYGEDRRTLLKPPAKDFNPESLISDDEAVITITQNGFIKRTLESNYRTQRRRGIGVNGMTMYEDDFVRHLHVGKNKDTLLFFTNFGKVYRKKVYEIPEANATSRGKNIRIFLELEKDENVQAVLSIKEFSDEQYLIFATKKGIMKKSKLSDYANIRQNGIYAITLDAGDRLVGVNLTNGERNVTLITKKGTSITFEESSVKSVGRIGRGVKGITLSKDDSIIAFVVHEEHADLFVATNEGFGKRTSLEEYRVQKRGGKGVISIKLTDKNGEVVGCSTVQEEDTMMMMTKNGTLMKLLVKEISQFSRNTQGTKIINLRKGDELHLVTRIPDDGIIDDTIDEKE